MQMTRTIILAITGVRSMTDDLQLEMSGSKPLPKFAPKTKYNPSLKPIKPVTRKLTESKTTAKLEYARYVNIRAKNTKNTG